jgi:adenylate kinase
MNSVLLLSGVQGCGKTTVTEHLNANYEIVVTDMATLMFERLASEFGLSHRDQLRSLPSSVLTRVSNLVLRQFIQKKTSEPKILVTHFIPRRLADVYYPQDFSVSSQDGIRGIVMLVASPCEIFDRREQDHSRNRAPANVSLLEAEQRRYLMTALFVAFNLQVPCWVVPNPNNQVDQAIHTISLLAYETSF